MLDQTAYKILLFTHCQYEENTKSYCITVVVANPDLSSRFFRSSLPLLLTRQRFCWTISGCMIYLCPYYKFINIFFTKLG